MPWYLGNSGNVPDWGSLGLLALWSAVWTGLCLWHAARRGEKWWFILFLFVHTAGILEFVYLYFVAHAFSSGKAKPSRTRK